MIPTSDGSRAAGVFAKLDPHVAATLRAALTAAIAKTAELGAEVGVVCKERNLDVIAVMQKNVTPIENTALDAAADVLADAWFSSGNAIPQVAALGAVAAGVASTGSIRGGLYRAGSILGDAEAVASGNPEKIVRRGAQHVFWRAFGNAGRAIFRGFGGK